MKESTDEIINLVLTMIDAHSDYGDVLNFTKFDIDNIIKKYNIKDISCNELGWIILWENKYITDEKFCKHMNVEYINKHFYMIIDSFDDILDKEYITEIKALNWDDDWWNSGDYYYDSNVSYHWNNYTEDTLKEIMSFCFRKKLEIEGEEMNKSNTIFKNEDVYFNDQKLVDLIDDDDLDELKDVLNIAINDAQEDADRNNIYDKIKDAFEDKIGPFERKMVKVTDKKTGVIKNVEKIYVRLDFDMEDVKNFLKEEYNKYDFIEETYGDLIHVLKEMEFFDIKAPNYDYLGNGDIDDAYLNETTRERLNWE